MIVRALDRDTCLYVAANMRADDAAEIYATRRNADPGCLADEAMAIGGMSWTCGLPGEPICCVGAFQAWAGVWNVWMFATDAFPRIGLSMTKFARDVIIPAMRDGGHRAQCYSSEAHATAHKWLEFLGFRSEATLKAYGRQREDFRLYALDLES